LFLIQSIETCRGIRSVESPLWVPQKAKSHCRGVLQARLNKKKELTTENAETHWKRKISW